MLGHILFLLLFFVNYCPTLDCLIYSDNGCCTIKHEQIHILIFLERFWARSHSLHVQLQAEILKDVQKLRAVIYRNGPDMNQKEKAGENEKSRENDHPKKLWVSSLF